MSDDVVVTIAELRVLANKLCDAVESRGQDAVRIPAGPYWMVYFEDMFGPKEPTLVVGDVADDLRDARRDLLESSEYPPVIWHSAHHLAGLINALAYSEINGSSTDS